MPDFAAWASGATPLISPAHKAVLAWSRILDRPVSVVLIRAGVDQPAQTVRIEVPRTASDMRSETGVTLEESIVVLGVMGHPDTSVADTVLKVGDRFYHDGRMFELTSVQTPAGEIQGTGRAQRLGR